MNLYSQTLEAVSGAESDVDRAKADVQDADIELFIAELRINTLLHACLAATLLCDYRNTYGLKLALPWLFQQAAVAINILLRGMQLNWERYINRAGNPSGPAAKINDIESAFEECFHCLFAMGMQQLLPRAVARATYHTARKLKVQLPAVVQEILQSVVETVWHPSDLQMLNSMYPNRVLINHLRGRPDEYTIENMLREWEATVG